MKRLVILVLVGCGLYAADTYEMQDIKQYTDEQWELFLAMQKAANRFFDSIEHENRELRKKDGQDQDSSGNTSLVYRSIPTGYYVEDRRTSPLEFPKRSFTIIKGLLFDPEHVSFICSLGTWRFAGNLSFKPKDCMGVDYASAHAFFEQIMCTESFPNDEGLVQVTKIMKQVLSPAETVSDASEETASISLQELSDMKERSILENAIAGMQYYEWLAQIKKEEQVAQEQAQVVWSAMVEEKKRLDESNRLGDEHGSF